VVEERHWIATTLSRITMRIDNYVSTQTDLIAQLRSRPMLANPYAFIDDKDTDLQRERSDLRDIIALTLERASTDIAAKKQMLRSLSPQSTLDRGYSVVRDASGAVIADASKVKVGTNLKIRLAKGEIEATSK
jgi:exodeoxyribonuclease VII large subunit